MERESCLSILIVLLGGAMLIACGWWPATDEHRANARDVEQVAWRRIWLPLIPAVGAAAMLCGWAILEPDPVPQHVPASVIAASLPFALLFARTALRAARATAPAQEPAGPLTVGLLRSWVVFPPYLAKQLDARQIEAALAHERAHARHRDPLRIWMAQIATDLQWPWPQAQRRLRQWLIALELARDEEARAAGIDGGQLAEAILAAARFGHPVGLPMQAALTGERAVLQERIERLLAPPITASVRVEKPDTVWMFVPAAVAGLAIGLMFGEQMISAFLRLAA